MLNKVLLTPVDEMVEFIKKNSNCSLITLRDHFRLPIEIIERWLIVLEEYSVVKVSYKGFNGYVSYLEQDVEKKNKISAKVDIEELKSVFILKSKEKNISYEKMAQLWPIFIKEYHEDIKQLFEDKAKNKGYAKEKIDKAWLLFEKQLLEW